jgi:hypothetical protein
LSDQTSSVADTHASLSAQREPDEDMMILDTYGRTSLTPFAYYDPDTHSWKTSQGTLPLDLTPFSVTLPRSGSMRNGQLFQRHGLAHHIAVSESSSWPTPRSNPAMACRITPEAVAKASLRAETYPYLETIMAIRFPGSVGGTLSPTWIEWLMGFPNGWTDLKPSATP